MYVSRCTHPDICVCEHLGAFHPEMCCVCMYLGALIQRCVVYVSRCTPSRDVLCMYCYLYNI